MTNLQRYLPRGRLPGVDHAFFNDTGGRYHRAAAAEAYRRVLAWFRVHVDPRTK